MDTNYTAKPSGYTISACADVDCSRCPLNHRDECLWSDLHAARKRNGWIRVRNGEEVR